MSAMKKRANVLGWTVLLGSVLAWVSVVGCDDDDEVTPTGTGTGSGTTGGTGGTGGTTGGTGGTTGGTGGTGGGGGVTWNDPSKTPSDHVSPNGTVGTQAAFIGTAMCVCHSDKLTEHAQQAHGYDFTSHPVTGGDLIYGYSGRCAPCHTVGYGEPTGFDSGGGGGGIAELEGIGCEECHGPGSLHNGDPSMINGVPNAKDTCWDCHVTDYKIMDTSPGPVTDADLEGEDWDLAVHHPQTLMFNGVYGYEYSGSTYTNSSHTNIENSCVTCHLYDEDGNDVDHGADALEPDVEACQSCHTSMTSVDDGVAAMQEEITDLLIELGGEDPADPGHPDHDAAGGLLGAWAAAHGIGAGGGGGAPPTGLPEYKAARHNYTFVLADASFGVHNYAYIKQLLEDSIAAMTP